MRGIAIPSSEMLGYFRSSASRTWSPRNNGETSRRKRFGFVDCRPGVGLRMSPHFFNTDEEVREAMEILGDSI